MLNPLDRGALIELLGWTEQPVRGLDGRWRLVLASPVSHTRYAMSAQDTARPDPSVWSELPRTVALIPPRLATHPGWADRLRELLARHPREEVRALADRDGLTQSERVELALAALRSGV